MEPKIIPGYIKRYLNGSCSEEESRQVEEWYYSFEKNHDLISALNQEQKELLKRKLLEQVRNNIRLKENRAVKRPIQSRWLKIAAAVVMASGLAYLAKMYLADDPSGRQSMHQVINTRQNLQKFTLPDSSAAWLYPDTKIEYGKFENNKREIWLSGEAFFEVARDTLRPFLIHSGNLTTRVLGTSFGIKAWPGDTTISVAVRTGIVALLAGSLKGGSSPSRDSLVLTSSQRAVFSKKAGKLIKEPEKSQPEKSIWITASLSFHNTSLKEITGILSGHFGVRINIANEQINNCTIRADFTDQHLATIIEAICKSINANYTITANRITITGVGCGLGNAPDNEQKEAL